MWWSSSNCRLLFQEPTGLDATLRSWYSRKSTKVMAIWSSSCNLSLTPAAKITSCAKMRIRRQKAPAVGQKFSKSCNVFGLWLRLTLVICLSWTIVIVVINQPSYLGGPTFWSCFLFIINFLGLQKTKRITCINTKAHQAVTSQILIVADSNGLDWLNQIDWWLEFFKSCVWILIYVLVEENKRHFEYSIRISQSNTM